EWLDPVMGMADPKTVTITNEGTIDLTITDIQKQSITPMSGEALFTFSVDPATTPITLTPSESTTFDIVFTRAMDDVIEQQYAGDVVIVNDGAGGNVTISVSVDYTP